MCGIVGFRRSLNGNILKYKESVYQGSVNLQHRGPDGEGFYEDAEILLAHRRLSIFDISEKGAQPMISRDASKVLVLNGEIYNFKELKDVYLRDIKLRSNSDTEVLLECFALLGVERTLREVRGMYAFCYHDIIANVSYIGRDYFGEKPLYYFLREDGLFFSSDLKGLMPSSDTKAINSSVLKAFLRFGYCPGDYSIFEGIMKLRPGHLLIYNGSRIENRALMDLGEFTEVSDESYSVKYERFKWAVERSIHERSAADVPVGALLSGGVDSSLISAVLSSRGPIDTFNLAFFDKDFDESVIAKRVSEHLGTNHSTLYFSASDALSMIPRIPDVFSEPFADISLLPTLAITEFARGKVTVALSGDGGDEFLFGYNKYFSMNCIRKIRKIAGPLALYNIADIIPFVDRRKKDFINAFLKDSNSLDLLFSSYNRTLDGLLVDDKVEVLNAYIINTEKLWHVESRLKDISQYLSDDILVKSDRSSMFNSLELRAPLLDIDVMRSSFAFKQEELYKNGIGKLPLRQMLSEYVPSSVYNIKKKRGFSIPIERWLKSDLKELIDYQLSERKIKSDNIFNYSKLRLFYDQFYIYNQNHAQLLWSVLMFNLWYDKYINQ